MEIIDCSKYEYVWYRIMSEDTLLSIADKLGVEVNAIIRNNNNIDLYEGEIVKIERKNDKMHIVKPMETLESISKKYNITKNRLIEINNLSSTRLFVGQMIAVK
ncbi:MAG: LysM peptidoglycan-binding domain-containing protein [Clostridia bacterium]|nr:LysM peptidoglycan-binding domain-containing protein [Clostridia bacterium]